MSKLEDHYNAGVNFIYPMDSDIPVKRLPVAAGYFTTF